MTAEACDNRKAELCLVSWGGGERKHLCCPGVWSGQWEVSLLFVFLKKDKEKDLPRRPVLIYTNPDKRVEPLRLVKSLERCGPPNGAEWERNGAL